MTIRKLTVLRHLEVPRLPQTRHYVGIPPEIADTDNSRELLALPRILVIEQATAGRDVGFFLFRFTKEGDLVGDTWHMTLDDVFDQAAYEYGDQVQQWVDVPEQIEDPIAFALARFGESSTP